MAIVGTTILLAACLFLIYALVMFHLEAVRPPRRRGRRQGVIVFRNVATKADSQSTRVRSTRAPEFAIGSQDLAQPLPFGVRRLAVKSGARR